MLTADGELVVIDELGNESQFRKFFDSAPKMGEFLAGAGITGPPEVSGFNSVDMPGTFWAYRRCPACRWRRPSLHSRLFAQRWQLRPRSEHERCPVGNAKWLGAGNGRHPHSAVASSRPDGEQLEMSACGADHRHASELDVARLALSLAQ